MLSLARVKTERPIPDRARAVGMLIRDRLRAPDVVGHVGEGVFVIILPECSASSARRVLHRLTPEIEQAAGVEVRCQALDVQDLDTCEAQLEALLQES
jgi:GGDEF domain-containing protein